MRVLKLAIKALESSHFSGSNFKTLSVKAYSAIWFPTVALGFDPSIMNKNVEGLLKITWTNVFAAREELTGVRMGVSISSSRTFASKVNYSPLVIVYSGI